MQKTKAHAVVCMCGWTVGGEKSQQDALKLLAQHKCPTVRVGLEREGWDAPPDAA